MAIADIVITAVLILLPILLVVGIVRGWFSGQGSSTAYLTAFHDLQPKNKQDAVEIVIEQKAGKRWAMDRSGEGDRNEQNEKDSEGNGEKHQ